MVPSNRIDRCARIASESQATAASAADCAYGPAENAQTIKAGGIQLQKRRLANMLKDIVS
jgi:hypothetical protein